MSGQDGRDGRKYGPQEVKLDDSAPCHTLIIN
jgi:hypothetical protein